jgi:hypothetical protein
LFLKYVFTFISALNFDFLYHWETIKRRITMQFRAQSMQSLVKTLAVISGMFIGGSATAQIVPLKPLPVTETRTLYPLQCKTHVLPICQGAAGGSDVGALGGQALPVPIIYGAADYHGTGFSTSNVTFDYISRELETAPASVCGSAAKSIHAVVIAADTYSSFGSTYSASAVISHNEIKYSTSRSISGGGKVSMPLTLYLIGNPIPAYWANWALQLAVETADGNVRAFATCKLPVSN